MEVKELFAGKEENHMLPFLWVHGESEDVYRRMVKAIYDSNIRAFCVEARPHPQFVKEKWWKDLEAILDEAEKRKMKVWILDDKHFPTGYAAGMVKKAPLSQRRRHLTHQRISVREGQKLSISVEKYICANDKKGAVELMVLLYSNGKRLPKKIRVNELLSCTAYSAEKRLDLQAYIKNGVLNWQVPEGIWTVEVCGLTYDAGTHRDYINMLDKESCRILIDAVYEPHYAHFGSKFGNVIAGFFSDEPELGNGNYTNHYNLLGTEQTLPYSEELGRMLEKRLGKKWRELIPLLWINDWNNAETARVRFVYMDCVSRLVEECFSRQIGMWCREHGVEYIGHVIEDNNQHARTGTSLGHYFRGLKWQTMSGIDDIGGQVKPGGEDSRNISLFGFVEDGEFYQYALGKMGASLGALNPNMKKRSMCEIFGNYGWTEGVQLEKYLLDHFMVRGINYFVPHAFTCSPYPEKDCPPHFFAHGNNPQYRHFGKLMEYGNRVCSLLSDKESDAEVGILYHGETEWAGQAMLMQKPARVFWDEQIDFLFIPGDVFAEKEFYHTEISEQLTVNGHKFKILIVPYAEYLPDYIVMGIAKLLENGGKVVFVDGLPKGYIAGDADEQKIKKLSEICAKALAVPLDKLCECLKETKKIYLEPSDNRIRITCWKGEEKFWFLFNEGKETYQGEFRIEGISEQTELYEYDVWENKVHPVLFSVKSGKATVKLKLEGYRSKIIVAGNPAKELVPEVQLMGEKESLTTFRRSVCRSIEYPRFTEEQQIQELTGYEEINKKFSGYIRYETEFQYQEEQELSLEITEAWEGVEVFVNGISAGIQIQPTYKYDLTAYCKPGSNLLTIEVATTLARENKIYKGKTGLTGAVNLYRRKKFS